MCKNGQVCQKICVNNSDIYSAFAVWSTAASFLQYNHEMHDKQTSTRLMIWSPLCTANEYVCSSLKMIMILTRAIHCKLFFLSACTRLTFKNYYLYYYVQVYNRIPTLVGALVFSISYRGHRIKYGNSHVKSAHCPTVFDAEDDLLCKVLITSEIIIMMPGCFYLFMSTNSHTHGKFKIQYFKIPMYYFTQN